MSLPAVPSQEKSIAPVSNSPVPNRVKPARRPLDGVLLLDKSGGITSNGALQQARRLFNARKAGHTGTLDPMATGLLPVCFGEATKFSADLLHANKTYDAVIELGSVTDTGDAEGSVLRRAEVHVTPDGIEAALARFRRTITQVPPMHSALKHQGRPLYAYAREGIEIERMPRQVTIFGLEFLGYSSAQLRINVECSKGTYIRVLAQDIGEILGCGAHLAALRRTRVGMLDIADAISFEELEQLTSDVRDQKLRPLDSLVSELRPVTLGPDAARRFGQGQSIAAPLDMAGGGVRVYTAAGFIGLGRVEGAQLVPTRLLAGESTAAASGNCDETV